MKKRLSEESFASSQNSPGNDENSWDKMASCPTFSEESFTSSQNSPGNDENMWDKMASCPTFSEEGVRRTDAFWANEMGCLPEDLYKTGVGITVRGASDGRYAHVFRRLER